MLVDDDECIRSLSEAQEITADVWKTVSCMTSKLLTRKRSGPSKWENSCGNLSRDGSLRSAMVKLQLSGQLGVGSQGGAKALAIFPPAHLRRVGLRILERAASQDQSRREKHSLA